MQRMGLCIGLKAGEIERYRELHAAVWPDVLAAISTANIRNYSIFLKEPENLLFAYWEYFGSDFECDTAIMRENPAMQEWWKICDPLQQPLETRRDGEWGGNGARLLPPVNPGRPSSLTTGRRRSPETVPAAAPRKAGYPQTA